MPSSGGKSSWCKTRRHIEQHLPVRCRCLPSLLDTITTTTAPSRSSVVDGLRRRNVGSPVLSETWNSWQISCWTHQRSSVSDEREADLPTRASATHIGIGRLIVACASIRSEPKLKLQMSLFDNLNKTHLQGLAPQVSVDQLIELDKKSSS